MQESDFSYILPGAHKILETGYSYTLLCCTGSALKPFGLIVCHVLALSFAWVQNSLTRGLKQ